MFASGVWYCVLFCVSQAVGALDISLAVMAGHFRARKKSILTTQTFLDVFGPSAGATRPRPARLSGRSPPESPGPGPPPAPGRAVELGVGGPGVTGLDAVGARRVKHTQYIIT